MRQGKSQSCQWWHRRQKQLFWSPFAWPKINTTYLSCCWTKTHLQPSTKYPLPGECCSEHPQSSHKCCPAHPGHCPEGASCAPESTQQKSWWKLMLANPPHKYPLFTAWKYCLRWTTPLNNHTKAGTRRGAFLLEHGSCESQIEIQIERWVHLPSWGRSETPILLSQDSSRLYIEEKSGWQNDIA